MENFQRIKVIGKGSYGEVWLSKHARDKKQYVLKKMDLQKASRRERKAAEQEAKLLSKLKHPNIVAYKDSFETDDGFLWIAMGFCEGGDLYNALKSCKGSFLDERQIIEWFVQISMALQYLHERNILHRDLKTQNIFLTKSKIIKLGDLGIARVLDSSNDMATTLIGTPYYMSPELFSNKPYNHKSDVWALGCCVYEMATLKHAFNARDMNALVYKILRGKMPPMPGQYSQDLNNLIRAMLDQNPARRPSVNKILRDPFIKKNIAIFLEGTRKSRGTAVPSSARRSAAGRDSTDSTVSSVQSEIGAGDGRIGSAGRRRNTRPSSGDPKRVFDNPLPVNKPRPLPKTPNSAPSTPSEQATAIITDSNEMDEAQRTNPNMSARQRRRERSMRTDDTPRNSYDGIQKIHLEPRVRSSSDTSERADSAKSDRSKRSVDSGKRNYTPPVGVSQHHRQLSSLDDDDESSSIGDDDRDETRGERDLDNLERALDATLHINAAANTLEDDGDDDDDDIETAAKLPSSETNNHEFGQPPVFSEETLNSSGRLMGRIVALRKDCLKTVGLEKLHKAFQILDDSESDNMEGRLLKLLGSDLFDEYAGKIWQLKFCEESAFKIG